MISQKNFVLDFRTFHDSPFDDLRQPQDRLPMCAGCYAAA